MKNNIILKSAILIAAVAFSAGQDLRAQNMTEPYKVENGIAYKKSVSQTPNEKGEYTVTLETFITGEVSQKQKPIPADIVLVLDVSGSMSYSYPGQQNQYIAIDQDWSISSLINRQRYYMYEGNYYRVRASYYEDYNDWGYYLYFRVGNQTYYLNGTGIGDRPSNIQDQDATIYSGTLYRYGTPYNNRLEALQDAVGKFIDVVQKKDKDLKLKAGQTGNRIAIVKFASEPKDNTIDSGDDTYEDENSLTGITNYTQVVRQFIPVSSGAADLKEAINGLVAGGATAVDYGLTKAQALIGQKALPIIDENGDPIRSRTVVVFTDGNPTHASNFDREVAISAVNTAKQIKAKSGDGACSATVFSVGVFGNDKDPRTDEYMTHMSSNYPDATAATSGSYNISYTGEPISQITDELVYSIIASDEKGLDEVFETIADISSGQNTTVGDNSLLNLDIISNSFKLPDKVKKEQIHVYTAQCLGLEVKADGTPWLDEEGNQYLAFAERVETKNREPVEVLWVRRTELDEEGKPVIENGKIKYYWEKKENIDIDNNIDFDFGEGTGEGDNFVSVTGFNYSDYWCGYDADHVNSEQYNKTEYPKTYRPNYRGFKLIIEFPIVINPEAVGGPAVITNDEKSGLYQTENGKPVGEALVHFNRPNVKIPVSIWIQKTGLIGDDSAVFTISRSPFDPDTFDPTNPGNPENMTWTNFTKVVVNNKNLKEVLDKNGEPIKDSETGESIKVVKISGLDPNYFYRIKEDAWAWSYSYQLGGVKYTVGEKELKNPIKFKNEKKDEIVKHDEAVARNVFADPEGNVVR